MNTSSLDLITSQSTAASDSQLFGFWRDVPTSFGEQDFNGEFDQSGTSYSWWDPAQDSSKSSSKICPILNGLTSDCQPDYCGPDPACANLGLPDIEEAAMVPCLNQPTSQVDGLPTSPALRENRKGSRSLSGSSKSDNPQDSNPRTSKSNSISKQAHSLVERKYRENLNSKINELHVQLQHAKFQLGAGDSTSQEIPSRPVSSAPTRKGDILVEAILYVNQTEVEMRHMQEEIAQLRMNVEKLRKRVDCSDCSILTQLKALKLRVP